MPQFIGKVPAGHARKARKVALKEHQAHAATSTEDYPDFPKSAMPDGGWKTPRNLRGTLRSEIPAHSVGARVLGAAYPFLAESGAPFTGPYIGENMLSRSPFSFDPWDAYSAGLVRSHSAAILGVKGSGKSMLCKSWSTRLIRMGRHVSVPHDPNGEWARVAEYVGGRTISIGPGKAAKINLLDAGPQVESMGLEAWRHHLLQTRRATMRATIQLLNPGHQLRPVEHTALDMALEQLASRFEVTVPDLYASFTTAAAGNDELAVAARDLSHILRRIVHGDLQGLFDGPSTVTFDARTPMMVVETSAMKGTSKEAQSLARLATTNWMRQATTGSNRTPRVVIHEEAAVEFLNLVASGEGLTEHVANEKVARHDGKASWYVLHRIADLDALGDHGSALRSQALGLLADCDTRVTYAQHSGEIERTAEQLGWNDTQGDIVRRLKKGEGLWQIGQDRTVKVRNICTEGEKAVFRTDTLGGARA